MQGLPSAILGDQRELARLPEASVSNPIQAFSLFVNAAKGLGGEPREGYVFRLAGGRHFVVHQRFLTLSGAVIQWGLRFRERLARPARAIQ